MFLNSLKSELTYKKTLVFFILASVLFLLGTAIQYRKSEKSSNNDFRVYYKTAQRIQSGEWGDIYTRKDGPFPYRYVPYTLAAVSWMEQFPEQTSRKIWLVLQAISFLGGFIYLYKSLVLTETKFPLFVTSLTFILTFRQFMDSLYSGQVAGFVFLSFSLGMFYYLNKKVVLDGISNSIATSLKIMPGFLLIHGLIKAPGMSRKIKFLGSGILLFAGLNIMILIWLKFHHADQNFLQLWKDWVSIVMADGEYFDGSTPKSQSLRAFILRTFGKSDNSETFWKILFLAGVCGVIFHWIRGNSKNALHDAYSYSVGILAFIIFMPESLPYQLMNVAIPFAVIASDPKTLTNRFHKLTFVLFMVFISFASTDFIGRRASDLLQDQSLPFYVLCLMSFIALKGSSGKDHVVRM